MEISEPGGGYVPSPAPAAAPPQPPARPEITDREDHRPDPVDVVTLSDDEEDEEPWLYREHHTQFDYLADEPEVPAIGAGMAVAATAAVPARPALKEVRDGPDNTKYYVYEDGSVHTTLEDGTTMQDFSDPAGNYHHDIQGGNAISTYNNASVRKPNGDVDEDNRQTDRISGVTGRKLIHTTTTDKPWSELDPEVQVPSTSPRGPIRVTSIQASTIGPDGEEHPVLSTVGYSQDFDPENAGAPPPVPGFTSTGPGHTRVHSSTTLTYPDGSGPPNTTHSNGKARVWDGTWKSTGEDGEVSLDQTEVDYNGVPRVRLQTFEATHANWADLSDELKEPFNASRGSTQYRLDLPGTFNARQVLSTPLDGNGKPVKGAQQGRVYSYGNYDKPNALGETITADMNGNAPTIWTVDRVSSTSADGGFGIKHQRQQAMEGQNVYLLSETRSYPGGASYSSTGLYEFDPETGTHKPVKVQTDQSQWAFRPDGSGPFLRSTSRLGDQVADVWFDPTTGDRSGQSLIDGQASNWTLGANGTLQLTTGDGTVLQLGPNGAFLNGTQVGGETAWDSTASSSDIMGKIAGIVGNLPGISGSSGQIAKQLAFIGAVTGAYKAGYAREKVLGGDKEAITDAFDGIGAVITAGGSVAGILGDEPLGRVLGYYGAAFGIGVGLVQIGRGIRDNDLQQLGGGVLQAVGSIPSPVSVLGLYGQLFMAWDKWDRDQHATPPLRLSP